MNQLSNVENHIDINTVLFAQHRCCVVYDMNFSWLKSLPDISNDGRCIQHPLDHIPPEDQVSSHVL